MRKTAKQISGVVGPYASALFELALESNSLDAVLADIEELSTLIHESDDVRRLINSPVFRAEEQARALTALMDKIGISQLIANFVNLVARNRRLNFLPEMLMQFRAIVSVHRGEVIAEVTSAAPLSAAHIDALKEALHASFNKHVHIDAKIDASILGGLIVKIGSRMVDSSLRTQLNSLRLAMKEVG